ncbi:50S ribosomal protein L13 [Patescibacteria group bacterium]
MITIDVKNKILGRVASEVAAILRGKNSPDFKPNMAPKIKVKILNVDKIKLTGNKLKEKVYKRYSGYPGGQKIVSFESQFKKDPGKVFKKTVERMLPNNKLRKPMLKNLIFE